MNYLRKSRRIRDFNQLNRTDDTIRIVTHVDSMCMMPLCIHSTREPHRFHIHFTEIIDFWYYIYIFFISWLSLIILTDNPIDSMDERVNVQPLRVSFVIFNPFVGSFESHRWYNYLITLTGSYKLSIHCLLHRKLLFIKIQQLKHIVCCSIYSIIIYLFKRRLLIDVITLIFIFKLRIQLFH